jgi:prepilin-type N-terminal cleavage/methylation domain-containing protein
MLKTHKRNEGFTIIEVLIVLAIAGLILVVVFLAVPNLQRSQRNSARKSDASRISTAASSFYSNHNGNAPSSAADAAAIVSDAGKLGQLNITGGDTTQTVNKLDLTSNSFSGTAADDEVILGATSTKCNSSGTGFSSGTTRQMALLYPVEGSSGSFSWACMDI